jgi:hypothetical protein
VQLTPLPPNPLLQLQLKEPAVLLQLALPEQLSVPNAHSLSSVQELEPAADEYPLAQSVQLVLPLEYVSAGHCEQLPSDPPSQSILS